MSTKRPQPNWSELLRGAFGDQGGDGGDGGGDGSDGGDDARAAAAAPPPLSVQERQLARLWAGYGSVKELRVSGGGGGGPAARRLVAKAVDPPKGRAGDVGHQRKLDSYAVEAAFYSACAPRLAALAESLGIDPAGPAPGGGGGGGGGGGADPSSSSSGAGSWCWTPRPVALEAAPPAHFLFVLTDLRERFPRQPHAYDMGEAKVALEWLASFHAAWWEEDPPAGLWRDGCYWHLATRQEELAQVGGRWAGLRRRAGDVDAALRGDFGGDYGGGKGGGERGGGGGGRGGGSSNAFRTLCHGDAKSANFMFSADGAAAAAYDFQYCGAGLGAKDVAYLLVSSADEALLTDPSSERALLAHYRSALCARLAALGKAAAAARYTHSVLDCHYDLAMLDYCRFMAGWGFWGAAEYAAEKARAALPRLPELLRRAAEAAAAGSAGGA